MIVVSIAATATVSAVANSAPVYSAYDTNKNNTNNASQSVYSVTDDSNNESVNQPSNNNTYVSSKAQLQLRMQRNINELQREVDELRGQIQENNFQIQQLIEQQKKIAVNNQSNNSQAPKNAGKDYSNSLQAASEYNQAIDLILKKKDFKTATSKLESFLSKYPNSKYNTNAHFWLGQLYYVDKKFSKSLTNFKIVAADSSSSKAPEATYRISQIYLQKGDKTSEKKYLREVIKNYPKSDVAIKAKKDLDGSK